MGIEKTRQNDGSDERNLKRLVNPSAAAKTFRLDRFAPPPDLAHLVDNHWVVEWDLLDTGPFSQEVLPQPSMNLAFEDGELRLYGINTRKSSKTLTGRGRVFATKLRPGAG